MSGRDRPYRAFPPKPADCPHPDEDIVVTLDDFDQLRTRCEDCGLLLLVAKIPENEAYVIRLRQDEETWRREHPGQRRPLR